MNVSDGLCTQLRKVEPQTADRWRRVKLWWGLRKIKKRKMKKSSTRMLWSAGVVTMRGMVGGTRRN